MAAKKDPGAELGYEEARDALTEIVATLEAGNLTLEQSLELWERGEAMAAVCKARLDGARARLDAAMANSAGSSDGDDEERQ
jgi:exodeoxyribonuclease VII small subunit